MGESLQQLVLSAVQNHRVATDCIAQLGSAGYTRPEHIRALFSVLGGEVSLSELIELGISKPDALLILNAASTSATPCGANQCTLLFV